MTAESLDTLKEELPLADTMGCGEDPGHYGEVTIAKTGKATLKYDHGGIPWYLALLYVGYISFAVYYMGTFVKGVF